MNEAYFISPKGEVIYCPEKHITMIIRNPKKFGMTDGIIEYIHNFYKEKIGTEGKAREQILISLLNQGWIRIRKYGDKFWTVNVNKLTRQVKKYLSKWAKDLLKGRNGIKEQDPYIPVKIDSPKNKVMTSDISSIALSDEFVVEGKNIELKWIDDMNEMEDLPVYDCFKKYERMDKYLK